MRHILCVGAHPDDNEINVGGLAARLSARGDAVKFVSVTDGRRGHFDMQYRDNPSALIVRRQAEAEAGAAAVGATYESLGVPDGEVFVDPPTTQAMIRCLRSFGEPGRGPDLVLFNRALDYHRDHRYAAQLVLDATYLLTVPLMCPDVSHLDRMPVFAYWYDDFKEIQPFRCDIAVGIDSVFDTKVDAVAAHVSQFFEWLPYNAGTLDSVPPESDPVGRRNRIAENMRRRGAHRKAHGESARLRWPETETVTVAEVFQLCEYGRIPNDDELRDLFAL